jgi:hypothetical protein
MKRTCFVNHNGFSIFSILSIIEIFFLAILESSFSFLQNYFTIKFLEVKNLLTVSQVIEELNEEK